MAATKIGWALALAMGSQLACSAAAAHPARSDADIQAASAEEVKDLLSGDARALGALWAGSFVVTNPLNQFVTKAQVLGMVGSGVLRFTSYDRTLEYVREYGDIAIVAGAETVAWAGKMPLAGKISHLRYTAVWQRSPTGWQEIARHANIIPDR